MTKSAISGFWGLGLCFLKVIWFEFKLLVPEPIEVITVLCRFGDAILDASVRIGNCFITV